jgi:hypothetical protein
MLWIAIACVVAWGMARIFLGYPTPVEGTRSLSRREAGSVAAIAEAMFPPGGEIPASGLDANLVGYVDRLIAASHARVRLLMHLLLFLFEHATVIFPAPGRGRWRRFSSLSLEQRVAVLDAWAGSNLFLRRLCFTSLRAMLTMGYFAHPPVARQLEVAPYAITSPVCEADLLYPRIGALPGTIPYTREDLSRSDGVPIPYDAPLHPAYAERRL